MALKSKDKESQSGRSGGGGLVAWILVAVLVLVAGLLGFLYAQQAGRANALGQGLSEVAVAAGLDAVTPEMVKESAARDESLAQIQETIRQLRMDLATRTDELDAARVETSAARSEAEANTARARESVDRAESLSRDLTAASDELSGVRTQLEEATAAAEAAQSEAAQKQEELEQAIATLQEEMAEESARLQASLAELESLAVAERARAEALEMDLEDEGDVWEEEDLEYESASVLDDEGRVIGMSRMFSMIRQTESGSLHFRLLDDQELTYPSVPAGVVQQFVSAGDRMDMVYRFRIQGQFESVPPDGVVIRKYWRWLRRQNVQGEARFVAPEPPEDLPDDSSESEAEEM